MKQVTGAIDPHTRCRHYHAEKDIIAIKFKCCDTYYSCFFCHEEEAGHAHNVWNETEFNRLAILCGNCDTELTIHQYLESYYKCPTCHSAFNPRCKNHYPFYFEVCEKTK